VIRAALLAFFLATGAAAQTRTAGSAREVTVGGRFQSVVEVRVPDGARLELAIPADTAARVQPLGGVRQEAGQGTVRATATMVAWTVGPASAVAVPARIIAADGSADTVTLRFPVPAVRSVLPRDTAGLAPKPPKDVIGPDREVDWRLLAAGVAAAVWLLVLATWLRRRRRERPLPIVAPADARTQALEALAAAGASGLAERGDSRAFYSMVTDALRGFAHAVRPRWTPDLTTRELELRMTRDGVPARDLGALRALLHTADLAKFGRHSVPPETARRDLEEARRWVESFGREERSPRPEEAAR
jgi:hypothetical protein